MSGEDGDTIEEKRRKNVIDNQKFLESLKLFNVRDDFKSTIDSVVTSCKSSKIKPKQKIPIDPSELRRSSRIKSMPAPIDDDDFILSSASASSSEEDDDLSSAFTAKIDNDWRPVHPKKVSTTTTHKPRPVRKAVKTGSGGVKIFYPNIGLEAAKVVANDRSHKAGASKKMNVAISSSSEEED